MSTANTYSTANARDNFSEVIEKAIHNGPVLIKKNNKVRAAVISKDLLDLFTQLEAILETQEAQQALDEYEAKGGTSLQKLKKELGL